MGVEAAAQAVTDLDERQAQRLGDDGHQLQDDADDDEVDLAVRRDCHTDGDHHLPMQGPEVG